MANQSFPILEPTKKPVLQSIASPSDLAPPVQSVAPAPTAVAPVAVSETPTPVIASGTSERDIIADLRTNNPAFFAPTEITEEKPAGTEEAVSDMFTDFNLDAGQLDTSVLDTFTTGGDVQKLLTEQAGLREQLITAQAPSLEEQEIGKQLADLRQRADQLRIGTRAAQAGIKQRVVPRTVTFGEERALQEQSQLEAQTLLAEESNLLARLGLEQEARLAEQTATETGLSFLAQDLDLQFQVGQQIQQKEQQVFENMLTLRADSQSRLATIIDNFEGLTFEELDRNTQLQLGTLAQQSGIPIGTLQQGMEVVADRLAFDRAIAVKQAEKFDVLDIANFSAGLAETFGIDLGTASTAAQTLLDVSGGTQDGAPSFRTSDLTQGFRTDRHNNPTAMTVDVARQGGLVEGVDFTRGDAFPDNPNLFTADIVGDPITQTIKVIDNIGFFTQGGAQRWTHTALTDPEWDALTSGEKAGVVQRMYRFEGGDGSLVGSNPTSDAQTNILSNISVNLDSVRDNEELNAAELKAFGVGAGTTWGDVKAQQLVPGSISNAETQNTLTGINEGLDTLLTDLGNVPDKFRGQVQGRIAGITKAAERNTNIATFEATRAIIGMMLTRLFEKGRISDADREFYMSQMPNLNQTDEAARASAASLKTQIQRRAIESPFDSASDVSGTFGETPSEATSEELEFLNF